MFRSACLIVIVAWLMTHLGNSRILFENARSAQILLLPRVYTNFNFNTFLTFFSWPWIFTLFIFPLYFHLSELHDIIQKCYWIDLRKVWTEWNKRKKKQKQKRNEIKNKQTNVSNVNNHRRGELFHFSKVFLFVSMNSNLDTLFNECCCLIVKFIYLVYF